MDDKSIGKYAQFRYTPTDEEVRAAYGHILSMFPDNFTETEYREEIALLMAHINRLLNQTNYDIEGNIIEGITNERWKIVLETIKLKAILIKEQRLHKLRIEKARIENLKLDVIPKDEFVKAVSSIVNLIKDYLSPELVPSFIEAMEEILKKTTNRANDSLALTKTINTETNYDE